MGPRPNKGFVGLKNAGATCYMNSVIQQLYMIPPIRNGILAIEGTGTDVDDDMSGDEKQENEVPEIMCEKSVWATIIGSDHFCQRQGMTNNDVSLQDIFVILGKPTCTMV